MDNPVINGLFVFILGLLVVFAGMIIIIAFVSLVGKAIAVSEAKKAEMAELVTASQEVEPVVEDDIPAHVKAAIVAAISAYYFTETKAKCDFVVKRIKRF